MNYTAAVRGLSVAECEDLSFAGRGIPVASPMAQVKWGNWARFGPRLGQRVGSGFIISVDL